MFYRTTINRTVTVSHVLLGNNYFDSLSYPGARVWMGGKMHNAIALLNYPSFTSYFQLNN